MLNKLPYRHLRRLTLSVFILSFLIIAFGATFSFINLASNNNNKDRSVNKGVGYLEGTVTVGPLCPIEPCRLSDEDRRIALTSRKIPVYTDQTRMLQATIIPDNQGNYRLELPPGRYLVGDKKYEGNVFSKDLPKKVIIEAGKTVRLNINIDTGIR